MMPRMVSSTLSRYTSLVLTYSIYSFRFSPEKWMYMVLDFMLLTMFSEVLGLWNNLLLSSSLRQTFISCSP
jgi:hypothetical protein